MLMKLEQARARLNVGMDVFLQSRKTRRFAKSYPHPR